MRQTLLTTLCLLALIPATIAQSMWQPSAEPTSIPSGAKRFIYADEAQYFELDTSLWTAVSARIPVEVNRLDARQGYQVSIPMPNGDIETFLFVESPIMEASLAAQYPEISTYVALCPDHPEWYGKFDYTPQGFHGMILGVEGGSVFIDPVFHGPLYPTTYISYHRDDFRPATPEQFSCDFHSDVLDASLDEERELARFGTCELRTYRLALSATGEYTAFHGGTQAQAIAAQNTTMNRVNGVFERDIAITMVIVANNNLIVYTNAATDPFSNGNTGAMITENVTVCNNNIGSANYDIGHVFGTNSGGLAGLGVVCSSSKARGVTGSGAPVGDPFDIDYVAHEMGHQFNMNHTQNNNCNRNGGTAVEPGSASTIMGYAGICNPDVQNNSDDYFHGISLQECDALITSGGHTCPVITPLSNSEPTLAGLSNSVTIPANTPFALTAVANDPDASDVLTYCWEQMDNQTGFTMPPSSASTGGPMFRSLDPSTSPTRYFPNLQDLIAGNVSVWEVLPSVSRSMNFRVTVRDNAAGGGCNDHDDLVVNVDGNSGPFLVLNPNNSGITWDASTLQNITWDVANTSSSPVSCGTVDILLSLDGGQTFSVIASNVPNDGSESITVPNTPSSNALIMVQCANGTFFDVSDNTFVINGVTNDFTITSPNANQSVCPGGSTTFSIDVTAFGTFADPVSLSVSGGGPGTSASLSANNVTPTTSVTLTVTTTGASSGTNTFTITGNSTTGTKTLDVVLDVLAAPAAPTLTTPVGGAIASNPTVFTWSSAPGSTYDITIFSSINPNTVAETATGLGSATYTSNSLANTTTYYYQVTTNNACGNAASVIDSFTTSSCLTLTNTTNYVGSSAANTDVLSPITVPVSATAQVTSVRIPNMQGLITRINDIDIRLVAPSGTEIILLDYINYCNFEDDWNHGIEDGGLNLNGLPCPPTDGLIYDPENPLSTFDNELAAGDWNLRVFDWVNGRTPTIDEWTLEICTFDPCGAPVTTNQTLSGCAPYTFNGQVYNTSTTIRDTLTASSGCDSIAITNLVLSPSSTGSQTLSGCSSVTYNGTTYTSSTTLTENLTASNGCDSILTTTIVVIPPVTTNQSFSGCDSYTYNGTTYTASTTLTETLTTAQGCDSIVNTTIDIFPSYNIGQVIEGCDQVVFNGTVYTSSTTLGNTFTSVNGCDSIVGTQIIVYNSVTTTQSVVGCGSVNYNGTTYNATTGLTEVFASATGCDSTVYTQIIVESQPTVNQTITGCDQVVYNGQTYTSSTTVTEILPSIGCDTLRVTDIVVNSSASSTQTITGCGVVNYNGNAYTSNQVLTEVFTLNTGCDSVVTTQIIVNNSVTTTQSVVGCGSVSYNGNTYSATTGLTEVFTSATGCDSTVYTQIIVESQPTVNQTVAGCDQVVFDGQVYLSSTTVIDTLPGIGCDTVRTTSIVVNNSTSSNQTITGCGVVNYNGNAYTSNQVLTEVFTLYTGCDSVVTTQIIVNNSVSTTQSIVGCGSVSYNGNTYSATTGLTEVFTSATGCDSTVYTQIIVESQPTINQTVAGCDQVVFDGQVYLSSTTVIDTLPGIGCDTVRTTSIVVNNSTSSNQTITGCGVVNYNGNAYTSNQVLTEVFTLNTGCDSVVTTTIQIDSIVVTNNRIEGCGSLDYNGQTYTSNQVLTEISSTVNGCDSVNLVEIVVYQPYVLNQQFQSCDSFVFNGITYTASTTITETYSLPSGCDSIIRTTLIINRSTNSTVSVTACGSYDVNGNTYSQSQLINTYYTNQFGCDSIVQIDLTILPESFSIDDITSCGPITWIDGNTYDSSNSSASVVLSNTLGCDSTVFLNFTLDSFETDIYFSQNGYLAPTALGDSYEWLLCDSGGFTSLGETGPTYVPLSTGSYAVAVSSQGCVDTSACLPFYVTGTGIMSTLPILPTLRPNPINESLSIDFGMRYEAIDLILIDAIGQSVFKRKYSNVQRLSERLDLSAGVYFLWIESKDGGRALMRILKK